MNIGDMDQAEAAFKDLSSLARMYFNNLIDEGFNEEQAFELTKEIQKQMINQG